MNNLPLTSIDIFLIVVILFFTIRCIIKGFISELMSVASVAGGFIAGFFLSSSLSALIDKHIGVSGWNRLISFLIIFLMVYIIIKLMENAFCSFIEKVSLERLDKSLGLFLGILEGVVVVLVIVAVIDAQPFIPSEKILSGSVIAEYARKISSVMPDYTKIVPALK